MEREAKRGGHSRDGEGIEDTDTNGMGRIREGGSARKRREKVIRGAWKEEATRPKAENGPRTSKPRKRISVKSRFSRLEPENDGKICGTVTDK